MLSVATVGARHTSHKLVGRCVPVTSNRFHSSSERSLEFVPPRAFAAARNLIVDRITAEVVAKFAAAGVRPILLKGPSVARWLYDDAPRMYADTDLLVSPNAAELAEAILGYLDFEPPLPESSAERPWRVHDWRRNRDGAFIDLHRTIPGARADPALVWSALSRDTDRMEIGGVAVETLSLPARALHAAIHAAQPGADMAKPLEDLNRALDKAPLHAWEDAATIAEEIEAADALAGGLELLPAGREVLRHIGLSGTPTIETSLAHADLSRSVTGYAIALEELGEIPGMRAKAGWLRSKALPPPVFMRYWTPLARRGRAGLLVAYIWRWVWLTKNAVPGLTAWVWARRRSRPSGR